MVTGRYPMFLLLDNWFWGFVEKRSIESGLGSLDAQLCPNSCKLTVLALPMVHTQPVSSNQLVPAADTVAAKEDPGNRGCSSHLGATGHSLVADLRSGI